MRQDTQRPNYKQLHGEFIRAKNGALLKLETRLFSQKTKPGKIKAQCTRITICGSIYKQKRCVCVCVCVCVTGEFEKNIIPE